MDAHGAGRQETGRGCCDQRRGPQGAGGAHAERPWAEGTSPSVASSGPGPHEAHRAIWASHLRCAQIPCEVQQGET